MIWTQHFVFYGHAFSSDNIIKGHSDQLFLNKGFMNWKCTTNLFGKKFLNYMKNLNVTLTTLPTRLHWILVIDNYNCQRIKIK